MTSSHVDIRDFTKLPGHIIDGKWHFPTVIIQGRHQSSWTAIVQAVRPNTKIPVDIEPYLTNVPANIWAMITVEAKTENSKIRDSVPTVITAGKNKGRANETNAVCQAMRDAYGQYLKKLKKSAATYPPMLAQILKDQKKQIKYPAYIQRKFNGVRMVAALIDSKIVLYSRGSSVYSGMNYIREEVRALIGDSGLYLDGEVYKHGMSLQDISGIARKGEEEPKLNFMIYDCFTPPHDKMLFSERNNILRNLKFADMQYCILAETFMVENLDEAAAFYNRFLAEGYEGAMVRIDAPYEFSYNSYHSKVLLKMKPCYDAEYTITGWSTGEKGKAAAALMIECIANGHKFNVTPAMELEERNALAAAMPLIEPNGKTHFENHYLDRQITVYYDELSKDKVPQRARTKLEFR